jgi:HEAT repeat protein
MTAEEIRELFRKSLAGDDEDEEPWAAVEALRRDGCRETFAIAADWTRSAEPRKRKRAADVLAQLRKPGPPPCEWLFRDEAYALIVEMLETETDARVISSGLAAIGHLYNNAAIPVILRYVCHSDRDVRFDAACALGHFSNDCLAISGLLALTRDESAEVRDWAVFGLGVLGDADSAEIREALFHCLSDENEDVREEAAIGLGKRRDNRLIPALSRMLDAPELKVRVAEAASLLLGLPKDPPEWDAGDYKDALKKSSAAILSGQRKSGPSPARGFD